MQKLLHSANVDEFVGCTALASMEPGTETCNLIYSSLASSVVPWKSLMFSSVHLLVPVVVLGATMCLTGLQHLAHLRAIAACSPGSSLPVT